MKKVLGALFIASAVFGLTGCKKETVDNKDVIETEKEFYEPKINIPKIYLVKGAVYAGTELENYITQFAKVTFDAAYVDEKPTVIADVSSIAKDSNNKLSNVGVYEINFTVTYGSNTKVQKGIVEVVERTVLKVTETSPIAPFVPSIDMGDADNIINYLEGIKFTEFDGTDEHDINADKIEADDATVRLAVPGVHLVKFTITCQKKYKYHYYREVTVKEAETPTKAQFEQYFVYGDSGFKCTRAVGTVFPKHLFVPSKYMDGNELVEIKKYDKAGCDFMRSGSEITGNTNALRDAYRQVMTIIYAEGHTQILDSYFAISPHRKTDASPSIESIHLPETLELMQGYALSGTSIKTIIIPRSVKVLSYGAIHWAHDMENVVFLGMPVSEASDGHSVDTKVSSTARILEEFFKVAPKVTTYFYIDYLLGVSNETVNNELFRDVYAWVRKHSKVANLNSFVNYNKILL